MYLESSGLKGGMRRRYQDQNGDHNGTSREGRRL